MYICHDVDLISIGGASLLVSYPDGRQILFQVMRYEIDRASSHERSESQTIRRCPVREITKGTDPNNVSLAVPCLFFSPTSCCYETSSSLLTVTLSTSGPSSDSVSELKRLVTLVPDHDLMAHTRSYPAQATH